MEYAHYVFGVAGPKRFANLRRWPPFQRITALWKNGPIAGATFAAIQLLFFACSPSTTTTTTTIATTSSTTTPCPSTPVVIQIFGMGLPQIIPDDVYPNNLGGELVPSAVLCANFALVGGDLCGRHYECHFGHLASRFDHLDREPGWEYLAASPRQCIGHRVSRCECCPTI